MHKVILNREPDGPITHICSSHGFDSFVDKKIMQNQRVRFMNKLLIHRIVTNTDVSSHRVAGIAHMKRTQPEQIFEQVDQNDHNPQEI